MQQEPVYIALCSFGKDSIATVLLALEHGEPLDYVVFSEVMFSHAEGISGEIPEHIDWITGVAIPKLESMGVKVVVVRAERDYLYYFTKGNETKRGKYVGKLRGFPIGGRCTINRDLKLKPIHDFYRSFGKRPIIQYVGIAIDEPKRLKRLRAKGNRQQISLLAKYGYTEQDAKNSAQDYGLLSPIYETGTRSGCWFCPNCRIPRFCEFRKSHPDLWDRLRKLSHTPNLCSYGFKYGKSLQEIEKLMDAQDAQLTLLQLFD
jgi:3'-phosphoadenosine 5'-phosphosulfate sulfotransferase (PAPS reductase)/FAD synthetase